MNQDIVKNKYQENGDLAKFEINPNYILSSENVRGKLHAPERQEKSKFFGAIVYLFLAISFTITSVLIFADSSHSRKNSAIKVYLYGFEYPYNKIRDGDSFFKLLREQATYGSTFRYANGYPFLDLAYANTIISDLRIVQRRIKTKSSDSEFLNQKWDVWVNTGFNPLSLENSNEDKSSLGTYDICNADVLDRNEICEYTSKYRIPGYVHWAYLLPYQDKSRVDVTDDVKKKIYDLTNKWIDAKTRSVISDFVMYSAYMKLYSYVRYTYKNSESGSTNVKAYFCHIEKEYYTTSGIKLFCSICQLIFVFFLLILIVKQTFVFYNTYKEVKSDLEDDEINKMKYNKKFADILNKPKKNQGFVCLLSKNLNWGYGL